MNGKQYKTLEMQIIELFGSRGLKVESISFKYPVWKITVED